MRTFTGDLQTEEERWGRIIRERVTGRYASGDGAARGYDAGSGAIAGGTRTESA